MAPLPIRCSNAVGGGLVEIGIEIGIEIDMVLSHEKLDVYRFSIGYVAWVAAMFSRLGGRGYSVKEGFGEYGYTEFDPDPDPDSDFDKI